MNERQLLEALKIIISVLSEEQKEKICRMFASNFEPEFRWLARDIRRQM